MASFDESIIQEIDKEILLFKESLNEIRLLIVKNDISKYPIFIMYTEEFIELGRQVIDGEEVASKWSVNASHLEEMVHRGIITEEKVDEFRNTYKQKDDELCILLIHQAESKFVFVPC